MSNYSFKDEVAIAEWLKRVLYRSVRQEIVVLDIVFTTDDKLLEINQKTFNHDYYTDIVTIDYSSSNTYYAELFVSIERIEDNAKTNKVSSKEELLRVLSHGILHTIGFGDSTDDEKETMRRQENELMKMFHVELN